MPHMRRSVLVLGLAYKPDVDDVRESPSFDLIEKLERLGASVEYHDPHVRVGARVAERLGRMSDDHIVRGLRGRVHRSPPLHQLGERTPLVVVDQADRQVARILQRSKRPVVLAADGTMEVA